MVYRIGYQVGTLVTQLWFIDTIWVLPFGVTYSLISRKAITKAHTVVRSGTPVPPLYLTGPLAALCHLYPLVYSDFNRYSSLLFKDHYFSYYY
jgi:hypothetical protein